MTGDERAMLEAVAMGGLGQHMGLDRKHLDAAAIIASEFARRGAHDKAVRLFATIVLCDPQHRSAQIGLAAGALEMGQPYIAVQAAAALIASEPTHPLGYLLSGKGCLLAQEWPEAEEDLSRAAELARARQDGAVAAEAEMLLAGLRRSAKETAPAAPSIRFG